MNHAAAEKVSFVELARRIIEQIGKPLSAGEIWVIAEQSGQASLLKGSGKTPGASLGARLYTDVQKPDSVFVKLGSRPAKFFLKALNGSAATIDEQTVALPAETARKRTYPERELHPLLVSFADANFAAHCKTVFHERSVRRGEKQNQWLHPDVVGFALSSKDWTHEVVQLAQTSGELAARLYSFEVKVSLDFLTLREYFFQTVSNSSWANEGAV